MLEVVFLYFIKNFSEHFSAYLKLISKWERGSTAWARTKRWAKTQYGTELWVWSRICSICDSWSIWLCLLKGPKNNSSCLNSGKRWICCISHSRKSDQKLTRVQTLTKQETKMCPRQLLRANTFNAENNVLKLLKWCIPK